MWVFTANFPLYECPPMTTETEITSKWCLYCEAVDTLNFQTCSIVKANLNGTLGYIHPVSLIFFVPCVATFLFASSRAVLAEQGKVVT